ncbi:regulatory protein, luxR family [Solimonas aquatica]|uniref:Regulatory protein, luxR family n=1 Tax=Solimonas aquatica TaxID=489703 RepID=A0A1H9LTG1_9GAMM|nr:response regulator transcription factor [Solimonas aquatica]SER14690.1 regulatory protein, luxR family [Solimonas aquatica]
MSKIPSAETPDSESTRLTARALRGRMRSVEHEASRLHLLESCAQTLAEDSSFKSALGSVLALSLRHLGADTGLLLWQDGGALTVQAAQGDALPVGARIPVGGVLAAVLRPPLQASLRKHIESRLRLGRDSEVAWELLLPLRLSGKGLGVLALMSRNGRLMPSAEDLHTLLAVATLLAGALAASIARPRAQKREAAHSLSRLTPREQQVLALLPQGLSNSEIAAQLGISTGTAKIHVERILHKLGLKDRTQAAVRATEWGHRT